MALGACETGLLLGYIPATVEYEAMDAKAHTLDTSDLALASDPGRELLDYVTA